MKFHLPTFPEQLFIDFLTSTAQIYTEIVEANVNFRKSYNRFFNFEELTAECKKIIKREFLQHIETPVACVQNTIIYHLNFHYIATEIFDKVLNSSIEYIVTGSITNPAEYWDLTVDNWYQTMEEFFENKYLKIDENT